MQAKRKSTACSLSVAMALALVAPLAYAGGPLQYERVNVKNLVEDDTYGQFVVKYREGSAQRNNRASLQQSVSTAATRALPAGRGGAALRVSLAQRLAVGADVLQLSRKLDRVEAEALMRQIAADPNVEYVEPVLHMVRYATPTDPGWASQWGLKVPAESAGGINLPPALDRATGSGVVVAVLDTGVTEHPDLSANVLFNAGYDFVEDKTGGYDPGDWITANQCGGTHGAQASSWHGTHVAGTVAAVNDNGIGVASVAPESVILPVRVLGPCGGSSVGIADAIMWVAGASVSGVPDVTVDVEVINMSLGGSRPAACPNIYRDALAHAHQQGITVVVAAGNDDANVTTASGVGYTMGNCSDDLVVVGGVGPLGRRGGVASNGATQAGHGSNHGVRVDIAAPMGSGWDYNEEQVLSTVNTGATVPDAPGYAYYYGTSMASPHVAGVVALMQSVAEEKLTPAQVKAFLQDSARAFPAPVDKPVGVGIVDADAAVGLAIEGPPEPCNPDIEQCTPDATTIINRVAVTGLSGGAGSEALYAIEVPAGARGPLSITTTGGSGDVTLLVSFGDEPQLGDADFTSARAGNNETVRVNTLQAGTYYIKLVGNRAFSNVRLMASHN